MEISKLYKMISNHDNKCPRCSSHNLDTVVEGNYVHYICCDCNEQFILTENGALIDLHEREVK